MVPPTSQWKKLHSHFKNVKTIEAQSEILQTHNTQSQRRLRWILKWREYSTMPADFSFRFEKNPNLILRNWPHKDLKRTSISKTKKDHQQYNCHALPRATTIFKDRSLLLHIYKKSRLHFTKVASPLNPAVLDLQNLENSAPNDEPCATRRSVDHQHHFTCSHVPIRASHASPWCLTRSHAPLQLYDFIMMSLPTFSLTRFLGLDPNRWPSSNRLRKKMLWPSLTFDFDQKVKNFKKRPVPLSFSRTFQFWNPFLCSRLWIVQTIQFPKSWLLHKSWPKCQNFQEWPVCLIFHVDSNFGVYFFIQESEIAQIVWFYSCWP